LHELITVFAHGIEMEFGGDACMSQRTNYLSHFTLDALTEDLILQKIDDGL